ncbi:hypothetical protein BOSE62_80199 [Bosea sp. 62]|nr:hypothetical protein BOSE7B_140054 [Bosea sp. 7B]VVT59264.1 hypothetical protein BOS5A_210055 [Bosea sp. EC-HK365B]VXC25393.1 hypothetical protein BOSE127_170607 [Bosea sp. 127]VXC42782.1 hypothetical protein BOSE29B_30957 [Bosea sp. 29B]VXC67025.1 hypothetical protein BOSE125_30562 [Bosea sp. 125]VXC97389.1 hypothetical protein BOSE62_80199 [Bosea sp. 62]
MATATRMAMNTTTIIATAMPKRIRMTTGTMITATRIPTTMAIPMATGSTTTITAESDLGSS